MQEGGQSAKRAQFPSETGGLREQAALLEGNLIWLLLCENIFAHTKVENSVSKQGSESKVEGMVSLLLLGETGHFSATKVSEEHLITQGIRKSDERLTVEKS